MDISSISESSDGGDGGDGGGGAPLVVGIDEESRQQQARSRMVIGKGCCHRLLPFPLSWLFRRFLGTGGGRLELRRNVNWWKAVSSKERRLSLFIASACCCRQCGGWASVILLPRAWIEFKAQPPSSPGTLVASTPSFLPPQ